MHPVERKLIGKLGATVRSAVLLSMLGVAEGEPVQLALSRAISSLGLEGGTRRQATDLVYTLLRAEFRCDFILARLFPKPAKLPALFLLLLKAAVASLLFQKGAPSYAVVNETVGDVRRLWGKGLDRVANGALRSLLRMGEEPMQREFYVKQGEKESFPSFCRFFSVPLSMGKIWRKDFGEEKAMRLLEKSFARPLSCVRFNRTKEGWEKKAEGLLTLGWKRLPEDSAALYFPEGGTGGYPHEELEAMRLKGLLSYQAAGSLLVLRNLGLFEEEAPFWDACAGVGGKSLALLEGGKEVAMASDTSFQRLSSLPKECRRLGLSCPKIFLGDASQPPFLAFEGNLILDAPCSGLGVLARRPDIKRRNPDIDAYVKLQGAILSKALGLAGKGRSIAYMTCTVDERENGKLVRDCLAQAPAAEIEKEWHTPYSSPFEGMYGALIRVN